MNQHHCLTTKIWTVLNVNANRMKLSLSLNNVFLLEQLKTYQGGKSLTQRRWHGPMIWKDMLENALSDTASWQTRKWSSFFKVSSPCLNDLQFRQEELESVGELSQVCSQLVLKCLCLARFRRPDILWSVNKFARQLARWISYIHHTSDFRQYCHVGNTAQHCRLGLFQYSDFAGDLKDPKSTSGIFLHIRKPDICLYQLYVQEPDVSIPHFYRIRKHFVGCWIAHGWTPCP